MTEHLKTLKADATIVEHIFINFFGVMCLAILIYIIIAEFSLIQKTGVMIQRMGEGARFTTLSLITLIKRSFTTQESTISNIQSWTADASTGVIQRWYINGIEVSPSLFNKEKSKPTYDEDSFEYISENDELLDTISQQDKYQSYKDYEVVHQLDDLIETLSQQSTSQWEPITTV